MVYLGEAPATIAEVRHTFPQGGRAIERAHDIIRYGGYCFNLIWRLLEIEVKPT